MSTLAPTPPDLGVPGLRHTGAVFARLSPAILVERALARGEGELTDRGALAVRTGVHTGRAPKDRYLVVDRADEHDVAWGAVNRRMPADTFDRLLGRALAYLQGRELFVVDA